MIEFLLTRPSRGTTTTTVQVVRGGAFLLTRPSRGATLRRDQLLRRQPISTHTPLAGRDRQDPSGSFRTTDFYSHAPRGARPYGMDMVHHRINFYSHAPRGARHSIPLELSGYSDISTHTPLAGRDQNDHDV